MKRFYTFFIVAMLAVTAFAQKTITINFEHPEHLKSIGDHYWSTYTLDENNQVTVTGSFYIDTNNESHFTEIKNGEDVWLTDGTRVNTSYYVTFDNINDGDIISVATEENEATIFHVIANNEHVYLTRESSEWDGAEYVNGQWNIEDHGGYRYGVSVREGYQIMEVTCDDPDQSFSSDATQWGTPWGYKTGEEYTYTITTKSLAELRTKKVTVNVTGDLSKFSFYRNNSWTGMELEEGENIVMFQDSESPFRISPSYGKSIYQVKLNGKVVEGNSTWSGIDYTVPAADGDVIDIAADYPDKDVPVKFTFVNEGTED
ncbi:MAG: hypothetical protein HDT06_03875, partial [Bacteroidales bacterium]|nr:hypothetical protein [Bacteroidales bacterium]